MRIASRLVAGLAVLLVWTAPPAAGQATGAADASPGRMVRPLLLIHVVADLDASVRFYREGLELEVVEGPGPLLDSALVHRARAASADARATAATLAIPGSNLQLQLIEFAGIPRQAFTQRLYDPGVTRFSIQVRDIDRAFDLVKDRGIIVDTTSAGPVFTQRPRNDTRAVMMRDPDGFVFEFVQPAQVPHAEGPGAGNIFNARSSLALDNIERSLEFYQGLLGFEPRREPGFVNDAVLVLEGTPRATARSVSTMPPGSNNMWVFWEFGDIERTPHAPNVQDPGTSAIALEVENLSKLVARMTAAGVTIETPGGQPVTLANGRLATLVRSPDGLLVELVE